MADRQVDARGLSCPEPVLVTKKAMESLPSGTVEVLVDTATAKDNIVRLAAKHGWAVAVEEDGGGFRLSVTKG